MDKVGDLLIRIKNGYLVSRKEVVAPYSKLTIAICELLKREHYIENCEVKDKVVKITLRYEDKKPVLTQVQRISKLGRRVYRGHGQLPRVLEGFGIAIISTPKGIMTDREARKEGLGGEVMAFVW